MVETTIQDIHAAYRSGRLTARQLVQLYLDRIEAYEKKGPAINAIITLNPKALEEADRLDAAFKASGLVGPLHGIPVVIKDQIDAKGMPTTLGSLLFEDYYPDRDAFVTEKLRKAGAIIFAKTTLGELGGGDAHGSLFGSTRNPYALDRTAGGSSGGSAACLAANFTAVAVGEEGGASIRRPSTWNSIVGMKLTAGLASRSGMWDGWPQVHTSTGPMARSVPDLARLLDVLVGYDPEDPLTALGVGHTPPSYTQFLDRNGLKGARLGILRKLMRSRSEPESVDLAKTTAVFERAIGELRAAGAVVVDPVVIPKLEELQGQRSHRLYAPTAREETFKVFVGRSAKAPFTSAEDMMRSPDFSKVARAGQNRYRGVILDIASHYQSLLARDELYINVLKVMADHKLDAIVYKAWERQPGLIKDKDVVNPPSSGGIPGFQDLPTSLVFATAIVVPAGYTSDNLPAGITFLGRAYDEGTMIRLAYAYEQGTHHRKPPPTTPPLPGKP